MSSFTEADGKLTRSDAQMFRRAIRERWNVPPEMRAKMLRLVGARADDPNIDNRSLASMVKTVLEMDKFDLARDEFDDKRERLDNDKPTERVQQIIIVDEDRRSNPGSAARPALGPAESAE